MFVLVHLVNRRVPEDPVGEARGVAHQLTHGGRVGWVFQNLLSVLIEALEDFQLGELGDELRDGIRRPPFALFVEDHHGNACDRLGHGVDAEDGVRLHGRGSGDILLAVCPLLDDLAVARKKCHNSGKLFLIHLTLHCCVKTIESLRGKAQRLRVDLVRACNTE